MVTIWTQKCDIWEPEGWKPSNRKPMPRVELGTFWLRIKCSTNWATSANWIRPGEKKTAWAAWLNFIILPRWCLFKKVIKRSPFDYELGLHFLLKKLQLPFSLRLLCFAHPLSFSVTGYTSFHRFRKPGIRSNYDNFVKFYSKIQDPMLYQLSYIG